MRWLLLRGLARQKEHWLEFSTMMESQTEGVLMLDLPGFGDQSHRPTPLTIRGHTEELRERFLELKGQHENWGVLGISMGGMIGLDWVSRYPRDFQKCVVINSSAKDLGPFWQRLTVYGLYRLLRGSFTRSLEQREIEVLKMVSNLRAKDKATQKKMLAIAEKAPLSITNALKQITASSQFILPSKIKTPLLVLASLKDHMVDVRCSKLMAEKYGAKIKFHPTAGHDLPLDDPQWVVQQTVEQQTTEQTKDSEES